MKREQLIREGLEILGENNEVFVKCVEELDNYMGFADGFRCYPMIELDDIFSGCTITEFLEQVDKDNFDLNDDYFIDTIYGLQSTNDVYETYTDNVDAGELFDLLLCEYSNIDVSWIDSALDEILERLDSEDFDEE